MAAKTSKTPKAGDEPTLLSLLDSAGIRASAKTIASWTDAQRAEARRYAEAVVLAEAPRPTFLPTLLSLLDGAGRDTKPANETNADKELDAPLTVRSPRVLSPQPPPNHGVKRRLLRLEGPADMRLELERTRKDSLVGEGPACDIGIWTEGHDSTAVFELRLEQAEELGRSLIAWVASERSVPEERTDPHGVFFERSLQAIGLDGFDAALDVRRLDGVPLRDVLLYPLVGMGNGHPVAAVVQRIADELTALSDRSEERDEVTGTDKALYFLCERAQVVAELVRRYVKASSHRGESAS